MARILSHTALKTCNVMAGGQKGDKKYFVPRTLIPLDLTIDTYCELLLPNLRRWRFEASRTAAGDKSTCCSTFLHDLLPWFVEVLVQDGIYLVKQFPKHPMSQLLKVSIYYGFLLLSNNFSPCYFQTTEQNRWIRTLGRQATHLGKRCDRKSGCGRGKCARSKFGSRLLFHPSPHGWY
jgi:hypothetical protein